MHSPNFSRPTLPPLSYALFLPWRGFYLRTVDATAARYRLTASPANACTLLEPKAREVGESLARAIGEPVELRSLTR